MPELPEVQTVVSDLNRKVIGRKIMGVWSDWHKTVKGSFRDFEKNIKNRKILAVSRRGKNIFISLDAGLTLLIHQKMTGHLLVGKWKISANKPTAIEPKTAITDPQNKYIHLIFYFKDGEMLALSDLRKFAKVILKKKEEIENLPEIKNLGPDALDKNFKIGDLEKILKLEKRKVELCTACRIVSKRNSSVAENKSNPPSLKLRKGSPRLHPLTYASGFRRRRIKQVLMDQEVISGIGNIYSDEILWQAKIHPFRPANKLSKKEMTAVYNAIKKILKKAIKLRGTSVSDFRDTAGKEGSYSRVLEVYGREGEKCRCCGGIVKRVKMGGRSAHFCPKCQL